MFAGINMFYLLLLFLNYFRISQRNLILNYPFKKKQNTSSWQMFVQITILTDTNIFKVFENITLERSVYV